MLELKSNKFPNIFYEPGKDIWVNPEESVIPFYFDVTEELTDNSKAMEVIASALDDIDILEEKAIIYLKSVIANKKSKEHEIIRYFLECQKDELEEDTLKKALEIDSVDNLSFEKMIDCLKLKRFGSLIDKSLDKQVFIMDLSFHSDYTDELMVIYFNVEKDVLLITHES